MKLGIGQRWNPRIPRRTNIHPMGYGWIGGKRLDVCGSFMLALTLMISQPVRSDSRLWLPMDRWELTSLLQEAAAQALATDRCAEILRGGPSARYTQERQAAFMVICRDAQSGSSYYLIYRQDSADTVELVREQPRAADWKRSVAQAVATEGANKGEAHPSGAGQTVSPEFREADMEAIIRDADSAWLACRQLLEQRVERMLDVVIHDQPRPVPVELPDGWRYRIDFDARNPRGSDLHFSAECEAGPGGVNLKLFGRAQEPQLDEMETGPAPIAEKRGAMHTGRSHAH